MTMNILFFSARDSHKVYKNKNLTVTVLFGSYCYPYLTDEINWGGKILNFLTKVTQWGQEWS